MVKEEILKILREFKNSLKKQGIEESKILLFGSYAKGTNREDSDIDVIVISDYFGKMGYWERLEVLSNAIYEVFQPIEAFALTPQEWEEGKLPVISLAKDADIVI